MNRSLLQYIILVSSLVLLAAGCYLSLGRSAADYFMPHAHCYLFNRELMLLHGGSDMLIGLAYVAISGMLIWLVFRARRELPFHWIMLAFATFIVACGATHFMEVWTLNAANPPYWLSGWVKLITAIASVTTAMVLPPLAPRILTLMEAARLSMHRHEKLQQAYVELNELYSKVKQMDEIKTNFFANVSHELRTPLALIFSPVEQLLQSKPAPAIRQELSVVRRNALLMYKYVNDLLDVSKLEAGKLELQYSRLDIAAMARVMANIFDSVVSERGISLELQTPDETVVEVDGNKVQRVFMNLLSNAFKYAPIGSKVRLLLTEDGEAALEAVYKCVPDLILTDMMMPRMTGNELADRLRQDDRLRDVPVILLTAKADEEMKLNLLIEGVQDYVMKPFLIDELRARVRNQLQTKLTRDALRGALDSRSEDLAMMARELAAAKSAAVAANAAKDDFLAVLSHELRTPLTPALAAASALIHTPANDPAELRDTLALICRNIELEARLVDDLLDVTRIMRGKLRIHFEPVDIHAVLRDAVAMAEQELRDKNITTEINLMPGHLMVRGDAARLGQVFSNLLKNAAKFTADAGQVTIRSMLKGLLVMIEVEDNGMGIAADLLPKVFEPFRQGSMRTTRRFGGLGLGLSVAKGLLDAHAGTISVRSAGQDQGTIFTIELPVLAEASAGADTPEVTSCGVVQPMLPLRVLLVEDHADTRQVLNRLLTRWGHTVSTAGTVEEARAKLGEETFDLLLSDLGLPDGTGLEVIKMLRETSRIPAVAMSGYGMEADIARTRAAGFTEHVVKPVNAEMLMQLIERFSSSAGVC